MQTKEKGFASERSRWLTNTAVNKEFANINDLTWSYSRLKVALEKEGHNATQMFTEIKNAITATLLTIEAGATEHFEEVLKANCSQCYQLLGVDVIIGADTKARVIEVNGMPSMQLGKKKVKK